MLANTNYSPFPPLAVFPPSRSGGGEIVWDTLPITQLQRPFVSSIPNIHTSASLPVEDICVTRIFVLLITIHMLVTSEAPCLHLAVLVCLSIRSNCARVTLLLFTQSRLIATSSRLRNDKYGHRVCNKRFERMRWKTRGPSIELTMSNAGLLTISQAQPPSPDILSARISIHSLFGCMSDMFYTILYAFLAFLKNF